MLPKTRFFIGLFPGFFHFKALLLLPFLGIKLVPASGQGGEQYLAISNCENLLELEIKQEHSNVLTSCPSSAALCGPNVTCDFSMTTSDPGEYGLCPDCSQDCLQYTIKPTRNDNPMNGVSTFDLVLMSKHILSITPLNSPYKIIAADINKSNSVTTFDIVELRKLILGIYTELPNNTSWRFIDQTFTFANPSNPFASVPFQEETPVDFSAGPSVGANFVGIKIGDLNNSVLANRPGRRPELGIDCTLPAARAGESLIVPVRYLGDEPLQAFQLALRFDPAQWQLIGPAAGDLPGYNAGNFGLTELEQGLIRTLWFADFNDPDQRVEPGAVLFYLGFKKIGEGQGAGLSPDPDALPCLAWLFDDTECVLRTETAQARQSVPTTAWAVCRPNPSSGEVVFSIDAEKEGRGRLALFGPFGQLVWMRDVTLSAGRQDIPVSDFATLPAGLYVWKVLTPGKKIQGSLIKQ